MTSTDPHTTDLPDNIAPTEALGRGVFSSREAGRSIISARVFLERPGNNQISVDDLPTLPKISQRAMQTEEQSLGEELSTDGPLSPQAQRLKTVVVYWLPRCVMAPNPYHADIVLLNPL